MKELNGFKDALVKNRDILKEMNPDWTSPEATAFAVSHAMDQVWSQLGSSIGGNSRSTKEVFGVSYKDFLAEDKRRRSLAKNSPAYKSALDKS